MKKSVFNLLLIFSILAFFSSCQKDETTVEENITSSEDLATMQNLLDDAEETADAEIELRGGGGGTNTDCPTVTFEQPWGNFPNTVTIDFGTDGCVGPNGRVRKGQIVINFTDQLSNAGAIKTVTLVDFFIDEVQVEGTKTITNNGTDPDGNINFTRIVSGAKITYPDGDVATWEATHNLVQVEGGNTLTIWDNVYEITGGSNGVNRNGIPFVGEIIEPLVKKLGCIWIVAGVRTLIVNSDKTFTLDYGNGVCNRWAELTLPNGDTKTIAIRRIFK